MRFLLAFVFSFISTFVLAQAPPMLLGGPQGIDVTRIVARNWMNIPIMTDTPSAPLTGSGWPVRGFIVHVAKANDTSVWQYTGARWARIGGVAENNYTQLVSGGTVRKNQTTNRFQVTSSTYYIKGVFYSSLLTNLNGFPKTANANGRIDVVALESSGPVIIQGVESGNPVAPSIGASRINLAIAYYPPFDTLPVMSGNGLISVFREPGVDSLFFVTRDTVLRVRDSVGKPVAGNLIDVSRDTVAFGDTMIKNTIFNTNGYTYRILKAGGDTLFNITPPGDILLKGRTVGDSTGVFSVNIKGNRVAFIDSIQGNESFEPKMLVQYTPNRPGVTVYPVGVFGGINGENRAAVNTISGDANVGAFSHTALGGNATGSSITFLKDRTSTSNYRRGTGGTNLQPNDVALDISASGGHYVSALSTASYKGLGGIRIVVDSLFGTNYRSNMRFFTNDASTQFATEKMRLTNTGSLLINRQSQVTSDTIYKLDVNGSARINGNGQKLIFTNDNGQVIIGATNGESAGSFGDVVIGFNSKSLGVNGGQAIGFQSTAKEKGVAIGTAGAYANSGVAIGKYSTAEGGEFVVGGAGTSVDPNPITNVYFGSGKVRARYDQSGDSLIFRPGGGDTCTINGSGGNGTNQNGGGIIIAGGKGTGAGTPGYIGFSTSTTTGSGTTLQTLTERARISPTGNLLVGKTSQSVADTIYKLDVNGGARVQGPLTLDSWLLSTEAISSSSALVIRTPSAGRYLMFSRNDAPSGFGNFQYAAFSNGDSRFVFSSSDFNSSDPPSSSLVTLNSTTQGLLLPRMTNTQRDAITTTATGLQLFSTTDSANYVYRGTGGGWQKIANEISWSATLDFPSTNGNNKSDLTINDITGASEGDVVSLGVPNISVENHSCYTAWVSATNQVTVRFSNYGTGSLDPASGTFKIKVFK